MSNRKLKNQTRAQMVDTITALRQATYASFVAGLSDPWLVARFRHDLQQIQDAPGAVFTGAKKETV